MLILLWRMRRFCRALRELARVASNEFPSNDMTCVEANALARMLAVGGYTEAACNVLSRHVGGDDWGDEHGWLRELGDGEIGAHLSEGVRRMARL